MLHDVEFHDLDLHLGFGQWNLPNMEWTVISLGLRCRPSAMVNPGAGLSESLPNSPSNGLNPDAESSHFPDIMGSFISANSANQKALFQFSRPLEEASPLRSLLDDGMDFWALPGFLVAQGGAAKAAFPDLGVLGRHRASKLESGD